MRHRTIIGFAILFFLAVAFGLCYVAFNTSPKQNAIWWGIRFHEPDTIWLTTSPLAKTHKDSLADSSYHAIHEKNKPKHGIKTIEENDPRP